MAKDEMTNIFRKVVIDGFLIGGLLACLAAICILWQPFERGFFCGDETLMFPYKSDTVTVLMIRVVGLLLPLVFFVACEWAYLHKERNDARMLEVRVPAWTRGVYCAYASFGLGACFCELTTEIAKHIIGRNRPHFFDVCQPSVNCSQPEWQGRYIQSHEFTCTSGYEDKIADMRKSFLSGHSSWIAYTMIYLALYLERRMQWRGSRLLRHTIQFWVIMVSWFTALSRISDYKHHWSDVLAGYSLGAFIAVLMFLCTNFVKRKKDHAALPQFDIHLNNQAP